MFLLIDNYDSFTYNLYHYLTDIGQEVMVKRNDQITAPHILNLYDQKDIKGLILSPGPCTPDQSGVCLDILRMSEGRIPILGVCLGHQAIGQIYGAKVIRAPAPIHGKTSLIHHTEKGVFKGCNNPFKATRYHSLIVERQSMPDCLTITAHTEEENQETIIMGLSHNSYPIHGVQFHPESIESEHGHDLLRNFVIIAHNHNKDQSL
jgi:anthranilate synthase component 2